MSANAVDAVHLTDVDSDVTPAEHVLRVAVVTGNERHPGDVVYFTACANDETASGYVQEVLASFCVHLDDLTAAINLLAEGEFTLCTHRPATTRGASS